MSSVKGCKRCSYKTVYHVDYRKSAQEQMLYYTIDKVCSKCNYNPKYRYTCRTYKIYEMPLDKVTDDMNIDLTKIIHEHKRGKCHIDNYNNYDDEGNIIEKGLIKHYKCNFCGKWINEFTETISICKHIYNNINYEIDYKISAQEQKIYYKEIRKCSKCKYKNISKFKTAELDNYPNDMNVDLSKIIHEHNHNKFDYVEEKCKYNNLGKCLPILIKHYKCDFCDKLSDYTEISGHDHNHNKFDYVERNPIFDNEGNCIELVLINHYKCDCGQIVDYTKIEKYDFNNPCDEMNLLSIQYKEYLESKEKGTIINHPTTNIGICPITGKIFKRKYTKIDMPDNYVYEYICSECHEKL